MIVADFRFFNLEYRFFFVVMCLLIKTCLHVFLSKNLSFCQKNDLFAAAE